MINRTDTKMTPNLTATQEVRRVLDWKWPHSEVVYPVRRRVPIVETSIERRSRAKLWSVLRYLENQARQAWIEQ